MKHRQNYHGRIALEQKQQMKHYRNKARKYHILDMSYNTLPQSTAIDIINIILYAIVVIISL